jgi:hypothetical protein
MSSQPNERHNQRQQQQHRRKVKKIPVAHRMVIVVSFPISLESNTACTRRGVREQKCEKTSTGVRVRNLERDKCGPAQAAADLFNHQQADNY